MDYFQGTDRPMGNTQVVYRPTALLTDKQTERLAKSKRADKKAILEAEAIPYQVDLNPIECRMHYLRPGNSLDDLDADVLSYMELLEAHLESDDLLGRDERTLMTDGSAKGHICPVSGKASALGTKAWTLDDVAKIGRLLMGHEVGNGRD
jgi:hypothetical protein